MWFILNFGPGGYTTEMEASFGAVLGKVIVPFSSLWAWATGQIAMALIAGISAKEVVVTSCAVLFGISNINSLAGMELLQDACCHGLWRTERLLPDDFLSALHPLRGNPCYD